MDIRVIEDDELEGWTGCVIDTFGGDPSADPMTGERHRALIDPARTFGAFDGDAIVGAAASFDFELTVPGGTVPMSGLTMVAVRPTHRRRGILRGLIDLHLEAARGHGDPISGLWASEATIYGRFGYGLAAEGDALELDAAGATIAHDGPRDEVVLTSGEDALGAMEAVYRRASAERPGMISRTDAWWRYRRLRTRLWERGALSPRRFLVTRRDGATPTGYVMYRQKLAWEQGVPRGSLVIDELVAVDARAERTLWSFLVAVDLFPRVSWSNAPTDSALPWIIDNPRRLVRRRGENLWLRIDDLARVLTARRYGADGTLQLAVDGQRLSLVVEGGDARCEASDGPTDLELDRAALGSLYLGHFKASLLARSGRVVGDERALIRADRIFAWTHAPWCAEIF